MVTLRPGRSPADGAPHGPRRPGSGAGRRDHRALPRRGPGPGPWRRRSRRRRPRLGRRLAAAARDHGTWSSPTSWPTPSTTPSTATRWSPRVAATVGSVRRALRPALDDLGRLLARRRPAARRHHDQPRVRRPSCAACSRPGARRRRRARIASTRPARLGDRASSPQAAAPSCSGRTGTPTATTTRPSSPPPTSPPTARRWEPASREFRGRTVAKTGPWGQGPVLLQALTILEGYPDDELDPQTDLGAHHLVEALKLALADRDAWYGDPDPGRPPVPLELLLSDAYAAERRALIGDRASDGPRPGTVAGREPYAAPLREEPPDGSAGAWASRPSPRAARPRGDTCHLDVVDRWGNLVSVDPVRRLAAVLAAHPRARLLPRHAAADDLARPGVAVGAASGPPSADDAHPDPAAARRRRRLRARHARRRPAGPVAARLPVTTLVGGYTPQQAIDAPTLHTTAMAGSFWPRTWTPARCRGRGPDRRR